MKPSCQRVLEALKAAHGEWVWGVTLAQPGVGGLRFGGRIHELRAMGYTIERRSSKRSAVDEYRLVEQPVQQTMGLAS